jgi:rod shape-determining protein MreC
MMNLIKKYKWYVFFIALAIFILSANTREKDYLSNQRSGILDKFVPIMKNVSADIYKIMHVSDGIANLFNQANKITQLQQEKVFFEDYYYRALQLEAENEKLKEDLHYYHKAELKYITGKIIAKNNNSGNQEVWIDLGLKDEIKKGQIVLYRNQLYGRVVEVRENYTRVLPISSLLSRIPAITLESKEQFVVAGQYLNYFKCLYLSEKSSVKEGEIVVTNNQDVAIISNMVIGEIVREENIFYVKPFFNLDAVEYVQVVKDESDRK